MAIPESTSLAPFEAVLEDRHDWIARYRDASGRKVAGYFCDYVPEEVLYAAGLTPVRITGGRGNVVAADRHLQSNVCSFARRCLDQALEGVFDYLDAVVVPHTCDVITKMYDLWAYRMGDPAFIHYLWVPHKVFDEKAVPVMEGEIQRLRKRLEEHYDAPVTDDALAGAIEVYDRNRSLLKKIYRLRSSSPPAISGVEAFSVALSSVLAPKEEHNRWMERFLEAHQARTPALSARPRVLVAASMLDDLDLVAAVEDSGAWVVADDVCTGSRYFWDLVGGSEPSPVQALARRYLGKLPCPRSVGSLGPRTEHLLSLARDYAVDGVIFYILRCCDAHMFHYPLLKRRLEEAGLKTLFIQGDQTVGIDTPTRNRIEAFTEMLGS